MMMALEGNNGKVVLLPSRVIIIPYGYQYTDVATRGNGHARRTRESSAQRTTNGDATNYFFSTLTKKGFTRRNLVNIQSLIRQQGRGESRFLSTTYKLNEQQKFGQGLHRLHVGTGVVQCVTSPSTRPTYIQDSTQSSPQSADTAIVWSKFKVALLRCCTTHIVKKQTKKNVSFSFDFLIIKYGPNQIVEFVRLRWENDVRSSPLNPVRQFNLQWRKKR